MPLAPISYPFLWIHDNFSNYFYVYLPSLKNICLSTSQNYLNITSPQNTILSLFFHSLIKLPKRLIRLLLKRDRNRDTEERGRKARRKEAHETEPVQDNQRNKRKCFKKLMNFFFHQRAGRNNDQAEW